MMPQIYYIETDIVDRCNLNCAGCSHYAPLADKNSDITLDNYTKDLKRISELFPYRFIYRIMGGEPFLHPQLKDIIDITRKYLPEAEIELVTNGTLLQSCSTELIDSINNNNISICISDYGLNLDLEYVKKTFKKAKKVERVNEMYNISLDKNSTGSYIENFFECRSTRICIFLRNGKLYHCPVAGKIDLFDNYFNTDYKKLFKDGIDIHKNTHHVICNYLRTPIMACKYCNIKNQQKTSHKNYTSNKQIEEWIIGE